MKSRATRSRGPSSGPPAPGVRDARGGHRGGYRARRRAVDLLFEAEQRGVDAGGTERADSPAPARPIVRATEAQALNLLARIEPDTLTPREALDALKKDNAYLKAGGVFNDDFIDSYIELKMQDVARFEMTPHPVEFAMYYSY